MKKEDDREWGDYCINCCFNGITLFAIHVAQILFFIRLHILTYIIFDLCLIVHCSFAVGSTYVVASDGRREIRAKEKKCMP